MSQTQIFIHGEGTVVKVSNEGARKTASPGVGLLSVPGMTGNEDENELPIILIDVEAVFQTAQTFTKSLSDVTYILPFGDQPTLISVDCLILFSECEGGSGGDPLSAVMKYYIDNRIKRGNVTPISITYAKQNISGFITKFSLGATSRGMSVATASFEITGWLDEN